MIWFFFLGWGGDGGKNNWGIGENRLSASKKVSSFWKEVSDMIQERQK